MSAIRTLGGLKTIARISARNAANALKEVAAGHLRDASNVLKDIAGAGGITVTASPTEAYGYGNSHAPIVISTSSVTVTIEGGTPPYSGLWVADLGQLEAISLSALTTAFRSTSSVGPGDGATETFTFTGTDANGTPFSSNTVFASVTNLGS